MPYNLNSSEKAKGFHLINRHGSEKTPLFYAVKVENASSIAHAEKVTMICDPDEQMPLTRGALLVNEKAGYFFKTMQNLMNERKGQHSDEHLSGYGHHLINEIQSGKHDAQIAAFKAEQAKITQELIRKRRLRSEIIRQRHIEATGDVPHRSRFEETTPESTDTVEDLSAEWYSEPKVIPYGYFKHGEGDDIAFENKETGEVISGYDAAIFYNQRTAINPFVKVKYTDAQVDKYMDDLFQKLLHNELSPLEKYELMSPPDYYMNKGKNLDQDVKAPELKISSVSP